MGSFDKVNYSLRPNKAIERALAFEGIQRLQMRLDLGSPVFIGFGSVWFADFHIAHRFLGIDDMISLEADTVGFARARFNQPFRTIDVRNDYSYNELPKIASEEKYKNRPWIVWLDYDYAFDETVAEDFRILVDGAPPNSIILFTFDAKPALYGPLEGRLDYLRAVFGDAVPDEAPEEELLDRLPQTLASLANDFFSAATFEAGRPGRFIPVFQMVYRDSTPMVTVGGVLASSGAVPVVQQEVRTRSWPGFPQRWIETPLLTIKETMALQGLLPRQRRVSRASVHRLGFDLLDEQIAAFAEYYRYYPTFAQVVF